MRKKPTLGNMEGPGNRRRIPDSVLYPLTIVWDVLLVIDFLRPDPLPFLDEIILAVVGFFLNRSALRRIGIIGRHRLGEREKPEEISDDRR